MSQCNITYGISALANWIADCLPEEDLVMFASVLIQLGDTLMTIDACRNQPKG